jgi:glycosyltransferase involved in cell wall biosynthesis
VKPLNIVHVSSLPPTACGVAEYTATLAKVMRDKWPQVTHFFVQLDADARETQQDNQRIRINPADRTAVEAAAATVNRLEQKVVLLQHEFKLYGGADGENIFWLLQALECSVVTTLHTVWPSFPPIRQRVFLEVLHRSNRLIVFSEVAADILHANYGIALDKIHAIPHGVPDVPFMPFGEIELLNVPKRSVRFITTGLLRPAKGIEYVIAAMSDVKKRYSDFAYVICGADHPRNAGAREYRSKLLTAVSHHGLDNHVFFVDRFLDWPELVRTIQACDVGILAYTSPEQSSSGVLALTLSCGRPVIATDFQYARAIVDGHNGMVVPADNMNALASAIESLALDSIRRRKMAEVSYNSTRSWVWPEVTQKHLDILAELNSQRLCASASLRENPAALTGL